MKMNTTMATIGLVLALAVTVNAQQEQAQQILKEAGVTGGLVVHVGCGDGKLTAALRAGDAFVVHGLDADVTEARKNIQAAGVYGPVSVVEWKGGALPYVDNLVNLVVAPADMEKNRAEIERILAPGGTAVFLNQQSKIIHQKFQKPWPAEIDEWTHTMHGPGANGVARDRVAGPPKHLQWTAGPLWQRSHGYTPSVSAFVSAKGRVFFIVDETMAGADDSLPSRWFVVARDAFNGKLLWKRPLPEWGSRPFGSGGRGRISLPHNVSKRLVAVGDTVYVTLGARAPVTALDAATGNDRHVFADTAHTDEIVVLDQTLLVAVNPETTTPTGSGIPAPFQGKKVRAMDLASGKLLWEQGPFTALRASKNLDPFGRFELVAGDGTAFILTDEAIRAFALKTGKLLWEAARPAASKDAARAAGWAGVFEFQMTTLVYANGVLLLAQPEPERPHTWHTSPGQLHAFDGATGRPLWQHKFGYWAMSTPPDVFIVGDLVWTHLHTPAEMGKESTPKKVLGEFAIQALDLRTGKVRQQWSTKDIANAGHHHRCYRNRITERFLTVSRRGLEFLDLATGENSQNHWARSGCLLGQFPANGMFYVTPHHCACYMEAKLTGFNALAPARPAPVERPASARLERGPAYAENPQSEIRKPQSSNWPTYRHDLRRSGATETAVPASLKLAWTTIAGRKLSAPVVADGRVFVADVEAHAVRALDAADGRPLWSFTADGPVDSPPTIFEDLAIFGSADGRVYALRATDGALVWRFNAAPADQRLVAFDRLESVWPVPGSVLIKDGACWFAAGRSSYLDGGLRVYSLDARTGRTLREATSSSLDVETGRQKITSNAQEIPGLLNDIPVSDGERVLLRRRNVSSAEEITAPHLYFAGGFLDDSLFNRTAAVYGPYQTAGLIVLGADAVFGVEVYGSGSREDTFKIGQGAYRLMRLDLKPRAGKPSIRVGGAVRPNRPGQPDWEKAVPVRVTAMLRAADLIWLAGPPDVVDPKGGVLQAYAAATGEKRFETALPAPPTWDGLVAADGRLFVSQTNGNVTCLKGD